MKTLIIGCGVAGPVAALALKKAGIDAAIYEAYSEGADYAGAFLTLASNGINALHTIGAGELVRRRSFPISAMVMRDHRGRLLGTIPTSDESGSVMYTIKRRELYSALRDQALAAGIQIHYGKRLESFTADDMRVRVSFDDASHATGDVLIGCDGLRSRTRRAIDPNAPEPQYVPLLNTGGYSHGVPLDGEPGTYNMYFGKRAFFAYAIAPDGLVYWFANVPDTAERPGEAAPLAVRKAYLISLFEGDALPAEQIIDAADEIPAPWPTYDIPTIPRWTSQRSVIIGDAAHAASPSSGQGASMAIEDGVVLAKLLRDLPLEDALAEFESVRRPRVERVVQYGRQAGSGKIVGPLGRVVRNALMRMMLRRPGQLVQMRWMFDHRIDWHDA